MREQLQRRVSRALSDELRELRAEAQRLAREQEAVGGAIRKGAEGNNRTAAATPTENRRLAQALRAQKQGVSTLLERMRKITEESEGSSPLLSRKLYDSFRRAKLDGVEKSLERLGDMLEHSQAAQAATDEPRVREALATLEKGVGEAAKGVLGDDAEALRLAQAELDALREEARQPGAGNPGSWEAPERFRAWADRLRDVQELLGEPGLRTDAARVLDRARSLRGGTRRHADRPQWALLETEVVRPLSELRDRVNEELRRISPDKDKLAPIDRDPVPSRYSELVRRYYQSLGRE
jgi:hypothetical protein